MAYFIHDDQATKDLLETIESTCRAALVPIMWGPPGIGKTALVEALAAKFNLPLHILIPSTMDPADVNGLPAITYRKIPDPNKPDEYIDVAITENTLQYWAEELLRIGEGILFIDEASTATPAVQASLLSVLQGRLVSGRRLSKNVWMIAAANNAEEAADGWELSAPLANRFIHIDFVFNPVSWKAGMLANFNREFETEEMRKRNEDERTRIVAFLNSPEGSSYIYDMPKDRVAAGRAWPSPRSWDNMASGLSYTQQTSSKPRANIILGAVGPAAGHEFMTFMENLSLPDTKLIIADPTKFDWSAFTAADVYIILRSVISEMTEENMEEAIAVFSHVTKEYPLHADIAVGQGVDMLQRARKVGGLNSIRRLVPLLREFTGELHAAHLDLD